MKFFHLVFLFLLPLAGRAQYADFPTPGLEYGSIYVCNMYDCASYFNYSMRYTGDTSICGLSWNQFAWLPFFNGGPTVRAEQGKYYILSNCSAELLQYDFTKTTGDTILTWDLGPLKVTAVGTFTLANGSVRKKMTLQDFNLPFFKTYTWVDGVGDITRGFFRNSDFEGGYEQLVCLRDSSGIFYHHPDWPLDCDSLLCPQPRPDFDFDCSGQTFQFINLSRESDSYFWDFGDGETATAQHPVHTFAGPGCYEVTLRAKSACLPQEYAARRRIAVDAPVYWREALHQPPVHLQKIQFFDAQKGWAIGANTIWKTVNGGAQWDSVPYYGPSRPLIDLQFKDFEHGIVAIKIPGSPYYGQILWTDDAGANWSVHIPGNNLGITAIERLSDSVAVVAAHYNGVFVTKNGGQTWTNSVISGLYSLITDFVALGGDTVYCAALDQFNVPYHQFGLGKSFDAVHWTVIPQTDIYFAEAMSFVNPQKGWLSNGGAIYRTQDGGENWALQTLTPAHVFNLAFADSLHGWACGHYTGIYGTADGGETWTQQACLRTGENIGALAVIAAEAAYVMTEDGLFEFTAEPDTISLCTTSVAVHPVLAAEKGFFLQPNPASDHLTIRWPTAPPPGTEMILFNAQGVAVLRWPAAADFVSVAHLPAGFYFVQGSSAGQRLGSVQKLVVCR